MDLVHGPLCGPPLIFKDGFYHRSKRILGNLKGRNCVKGAISKKCLNITFVHHCSLMALNPSSIPVAQW